MRTPTHATGDQLWIRAGLVAGITLLLAGCASRPPSAPAASPLPPLDSPKNTLLALQYALEHKDTGLLRILFTDDFVFQFSQHDSAGNAFRSRPWTREDELISGAHLCGGGHPSEPPADQITLDFTNELVEFPSSRPGHDPTVHREIRAEVNIRVVRGESALECRGPGLFFLVRGDSAAIPQELIAEGHSPDQGRWWIERWEDETIAPGGAAAEFAGPLVRLDPNPRSTVSWGSIKALYR